MLGQAYERSTQQNWVSFFDTVVTYPELDDQECKRFVCAWRPEGSSYRPGGKARHRAPSAVSTPGLEATLKAKARTQAPPQRTAAVLILVLGRPELSHSPQQGNQHAALPSSSLYVGPQGQASSAG